MLCALAALLLPGILFLGYIATRPAWRMLDTDKLIRLDESLLITAADGTRPAEVCGCSRRPICVSSAISLRIVAEE